jgi:hypothetical protein
MELFGFSITGKNKEEPVKSPITLVDDEGALLIEKNYVPGAMEAYGVTASFDQNIANETQLITKYREIAQIPEVDGAIDDIINEMMSVEQNNDIVDIDLDELQYSEAIKEKISAEFQNILRLLDFNNNAYEIARRWYEDGRLNYQVIIDENKFKTDGIRELRYIDPRTIKKIKEIKNEQGRANAILKQITNEYYIYSPDGFNTAASASVNGQSVLKLSADSVVYVTSGLMNHNNTMVLSHLHKTLRALNQLRALEDALLIYKISRAPERRVFYIDVGNLPKTKAEQHLRDVATKYKNKLVYDQASGEIRDDRRQMTMTEDYFLPRRSDGKATEITTLPGGQGLGSIDELQYFLDKLYRSLNVPMTRLDSSATFQFGRATEISRDEIKFAKFVGRMRKRFAVLFVKLLKRQLTLKNIMSPEEFDRIKNLISFEFAADNLFAQNKALEILSGQLDVLDKIDNVKGIYFSKEYIRRTVLNQSQEDMDQIDKQIAVEKKAEYEADHAMAVMNAAADVVPDMPEDPLGAPPPPGRDKPLKNKPTKA